MMMPLKPSMSRVDKEKQRRTRAMIIDTSMAKSGPRPRMPMKPSMPQKVVDQVLMPMRPSMPKVVPKQEPMMTIKADIIHVAKM